MALRRMSKKGWGYSRSDRSVATAALLMVTIVFLLIGFSGPSVEFRLPALAGWIYVGSVIMVAIAGLVWLFRIHGKRRRSTYVRMEND